MGFIQKVDRARKLSIAGSPLYYHGSLDDFSEFSKQGDGHHGKGYYFTASRSDALRYAKLGQFITKRHAEKAIIYSVELSISKPYDPLSYEDALHVAEHFGFTYSGYRGLAFHYKMLKDQMIKKQLATEDNFNEKLEKAGFDHIDNHKENYVVVFDPKNIKIIDKQIQSQSPH